MVGQTIGKYRVVSRLGRGGMGTVYKAVDETLDREVAIKSLNPDLTESEVLKRFRAEAITLARLNHPNIATLFELTEHEGQMLMVMEFVRGETFEKVSERLGAMSISRAVDLCNQVLGALAHAHRAGIVHRDLKPANLMLAESGIVKVMDFGLARMAGTEHLTNDGYMVGTPAYMSPEQVLGGDVDGRADLYAMGVVLYRLLTGQLPFNAESGIAMVQKQIHDQPTPVRQLRDELPAMCEELFARALAKSPDDRFQTADELKAALRLLSDTVSSEITRTLSSASVSVTAPPKLQTTPRMPVSTGRPPAARVPASAAPVAASQPTPTKAPVPAIAMAALLLLAAIPAGVFMYFSQSLESEPALESSAPVVTPAAAAAPIRPAPAAPRPAVAVPVPTKGVTVGTAVNASAAPGDPLPAALAATTPPRASSRTVTFSRLKYLVLDAGKTRDRDASLRLDGNGLHVIDGRRILHSTPYSDIIGIFASHSREPRWAGADGRPVPVARMGGGKFSFFKGVPDWVTVRTRRGFIPLRVDEDELHRVVAELESRTGARVVRTK